MSNDHVPLLQDRFDSERSWKDKVKHGIAPAAQWQGNGKNALWVCHATAPARPANGHVTALWKDRQGNGTAPVLLVVTHPGGAVLCGPSGDSPPVADVTVGVARRLAGAVLDLPDRHAAARRLFSALDTDHDEATGIVNKGLFATHHLMTGVPERPDWADAVARAQTVLDKSGRDLVTGLGYTIDAQGAHEVLRDDTDQTARAVAVFLAPGESPHVASAKRGNTAPVSWAMTHADRNNIPWVVTVQGQAIRLYSTATSGAAGQGSRETTYTELDLTLLPDDLAGYLTLLFSADALAPDGTAAEIRDASADYAAALAERLRERVYDKVVPALATAIAAKDTRTEGPDLDAAYRTALTVLFRLLFLGYAESKRLLPYKRSTDYTDASLAIRARRLADAHNSGSDLGFDNPLTEQVEPATDASQTDLWDACTTLFRAVDKGHARWGVPVYNGGLFSTDPAVNTAGAAIEQITLTNAEFGPPLMALLVDLTPDGDAGPIDFRSLSVREFGTIYEGLLESELAIADQDLALVKRKNDDVYEPASDNDDVKVAAGEVYLHNASGARKASGSYFTKPFAVEHLINTALLPTLDEHLDLVAGLLDAGQEADAATTLFDFRVADISMGSGHFLTAAVDAIEARISAWLADHPIVGVDVEIDKLRTAARAALHEGQHDLIEDAALLRRLVARRCVYGVDLNPISVELARVSMWIHTFVPGLPLSFLDHNLAVGNSLTGIATINEAIDAIAGGDDGNTTLLEQPLRNLLAKAEEPLARLGKILDTTTADIEQSRQLADEATKAIEPVANLFDAVVAARLGEADMPVIIAEADLATAGSKAATKTAERVGALHFPIRFPEVFIRNRPGFDVIVGNPPWEKVKVEEHAFWARHFPGLRGVSARLRNAQLPGLRDSRTDLVQMLADEQQEAADLRRIIKASPYPLGSGDTELARAFLWRFWSTVRSRGRVGVVVPRSVALIAPGMKKWRLRVINEGAFHDVVLLTNNRRWIFDIHPQYTIGLVTFGPVDDLGAAVATRGPYFDAAEFRSGLGQAPATVDGDTFLAWSPTAAFPILDSPEDVAVYRRVKRHGRFDQQGNWAFRPVAETHASGDRGHWILADERPADAWPVYKGSSFNLWEPETGVTYAWTDATAITAHLRNKLSRQVDHSTSAFNELDRDEALDPANLPALHPRIAFRDVARATDSRTVICALVPPKVIPQHTAPYLLRTKGQPTDDAYVLGIMSSRIFDWIARREVESHVTQTLLNGLPMPDTSRDHPGYKRVVDIAGRMAAVDDRYADWASDVGVKVGTVTDDQRDDLIAELDAVVARLYGLDRDQVSHIMATFHRGWDHTGHLAAVLAHFDTLDFEPAPTPEAST